MERTHLGSGVAQHTIAKRIVGHNDLRLSPCQRNRTAFRNLDLSLQRRVDRQLQIGINDRYNRSLPDEVEIRIRVGRVQVCRIYAARIGSAEAASCVVAGRSMQEVGLKLQLVDLGSEDAVLADSLGGKEVRK